METPFSLEEACERLQNMERVKGMREVPGSGGTSRYSGAFRSRRMWDFVEVRPISVNMGALDPDTIRYQLIFSEARFQIVVYGFLKRWDVGTTVLTGSVYCKVHLLGFLLRTIFYTIMAVGGLVFITNAIKPTASLTPIVHMLQFLIAKPNIYFTIAATTAITMMLLWLNNIVFFAHRRRTELMTRLEDMMTFPYLGR